MTWTLFRYVLHRIAFQIELIFFEVLRKLCRLYIGNWSGVAIADASKSITWLDVQERLGFFARSSSALLLLIYPRVRFLSCCFGMTWTKYWPWVGGSKKWELLTNDNKINYPIHRYTSIGERTNTKPNPYLLRKNSITGEDEYLHADQLIDRDEFERSGRF